ncbi:MAG TPA: bifunctional diaminohydroxyphosphoribosylaminopyrimidine deaminase/5-amino-6-(5-phosphoribosylamino)uracil reductase RibD [Nitrospirales bacterium]|nr:bifunctional diaminohydroxyphosphoribosylaminopyrimidine deaminase/5-amino-6-(5-phosphoribosylamino)uracil reductase RibD [Nitrospirales bacterium]
MAKLLDLRNAGRHAGPNVNSPLSSSHRESDEHFMARALTLAARGVGRTSPNPPVGAVVVNHGRVVGAGYHKRAGGPHAEVLALHQAGPRAHGGTLYVTLEPCCHLEKRTPPCVPSIIASGITQVVVATRDPNPKVQGRGLAALRRAKLKVMLGVGGAEAERLIEPYRTLVTTGRPFVTLKVAATLDGKIATARGESRWITGPAARKMVHRLRAGADAIVTGIGTVLMDDPNLTVRVGAAHPHAPLRIVLDPSLRIPLRAKVLAGRKAPTLIVTTAAGPASKRAALEKIGAEVLVLPAQGGRIQWKTLLSKLGQRGIASLLIEGGAEVNASVLRTGVVNRVLFFLAPRLLGGRAAIGAIGGLSPARLSEALLLKRTVVSRVGLDILVEGYLR